MSAKMATRTGSERAWRIASTVTSSIEGWKRGLMVFILPSHSHLFNSAYIHELLNPCRIGHPS